MNETAKKAVTVNVADSIHRSGIGVQSIALVAMARTRAEARSRNA